MKHLNHPNIGECLRADIRCLHLGDRYSDLVRTLSQALGNYHSLCELLHDGNKFKKLAFWKFSLL